MGFFSTKTKASKMKKLPKGKVVDWSRDDTLKWLSALGMSHYADQFKAVTGKRLLQLSAADLYQLVDTKLDADLLLDAIQELRGGKGSGPPSSEVSRSSMSLPTATAASTSAAAAATATVAAAALAPAKSSALSVSATTPGTAATKTVVKARGAQENAQTLSGWVGGPEVVTELFTYLTLLGIDGLGLVEATERSPIIGHIIGALWELHEVAVTARGNRANCVQLDNYSMDIMRVFDAEGKRLAFINSHSLTNVLEFSQKAVALLESWAKPGWLLRMAVSEKEVDEFVRLHNGILEYLKAEKVDTLPNGRQLTFGEYRDASKPLRRMLKQFGNGSMEEGIGFVASNPNARAEVAHLVSVDEQALQKELDLLTAVDESGRSDANSETTRVREAAALFQKYDKNRSGALELEELKIVLTELGHLQGVKPSDADSFLLQQFKAADTDGDNRVGLDEWTTYYQSLHTSTAYADLSALGPAVEKDLKKIFCSFASFGVRQALDEMDGAKFSKLCRDCKLLDKTCTTIDVDIVFAKAKVKGQRKITFLQFTNALSLLAEKKSVQLQEIVHCVLQAGGPTVSGTKADYVKFHDDKSTYTGVYARGGPTNVEPSKDLSALLDRSEADVRGVKLGGAENQNEPPLTHRGSMTARGPHLPTGSFITSMSPTSVTGATGSPSLRASLSFTPTSGSQTARGPAPPKPQITPFATSRPALKTPCTAATREELQNVFRAFATFGTGSLTASSPKGNGTELDGARFAKLCRECGLVGGKLNSIAVDIVFSKVKAKGARKIGFKEFQAAIDELAQQRGCPVDEVRRLICSCAGPRRNATQADSVRLHDDKTTYTGVYANGGPSTVDKRITLESLTDRTNTPNAKSQLAMD